MESSKKVIDISSYQPKVNYKAVKESGVQGVILRCALTLWGKQDKILDKCFLAHYAGFKSVGMPIGVYYYSAADSLKEADAEASFIISALKGKDFSYPIYFDVENPERQGKLDKTLLTEIAIRFCDKVQKAGYTVGVYASTDWFTHRLNHALLASKYTIWLADYRLVPNKKLARDMFQYTGKGKILGIEGNCDVNECYKDFPNLIKKTPPISAPIVVQPVLDNAKKWGINITNKDNSLFDETSAREFVATFVDKAYCRLLPKENGYFIEMQAFSKKEDAQIKAQALIVFGFTAVIFEI